MWVDNYFSCRDYFENKDEIKFRKFKQYLKKDEDFVSIHPASLFEIDEYNNTKILLPRTSCQIRFIGGLNLSTFKRQYNFLSSTTEYFSFSECYSALIIEKKNFYEVDYYSKNNYMTESGLPKFSTHSGFDNIQSKVFSFSIVEKQDNI